MYLCSFVKPATHLAYCSIGHIRHVTTFDRHVTFVALVGVSRSIALRKLDAVAFHFQARADGGIQAPLRAGVLPDDGREIDVDFRSGRRVVVEGGVGGHQDAVVGRTGSSIKRQRLWG